MYVVSMYVCLMYVLYVCMCLSMCSLVVRKDHLFHTLSLLAHTSVSSQIFSVNAAAFHRCFYLTVSLHSISMIDILVIEMT